MTSSKRHIDSRSISCDVSLVEVTGRLQAIPKWVDEGAIVGLEGGSDAVLAAIDTLDQGHVPVAGVWMQDWTGWT